MAHNIHLNQQTGEHSFLSVKEKPWHGLGKIVTDYPNSKEALQFAGLDFTVEKLPNVHRFPDGREIVSDNSFFTSRTDTGLILGDKIGADYEVVQNIDAFQFFDAIVGGDGIQYETAGALGNGERIFITAKLPGYIKVGNGDLIEKYLFLTTSHDGFGSITAAFTPVRIVCANTLNAAMRRRSNTIRIRHTVNAKDKLAEAHKVMGISNMLSGELETIFNRWATIRISDPEVKQLIQLAMAPNKETLQKLNEPGAGNLSNPFNKMVDQVFEYAMSSPTQQTAEAKGTLFGAYNAVTGYFQNVRTYKDGEAKMKSLYYGGIAQQRTQTAFELCSGFAAKGCEAFLFN